MHNGTAFSHRPEHLKAICLVCIATVQAGPMIIGTLTHTLRIAFHIGGHFAGPYAGGGSGV